MPVPSSMAHDDANVMINAGSTRPETIQTFFRSELILFVSFTLILVSLRFK